MTQKRILYITQEIFPYLPETHISKISRHLPQSVQEKGCDIRIFMPKYGTINERRNQLHEVIRLSGMNIVIDDIDRSLIIKVASIQPARMQVYFISNDDFFQKRGALVDKKGIEYKDNDERSIFFIRGVMETIKKLQWIPDIIHCQGAMTAIAPLFIKQGYKDDPCFKGTKVVYSIFDDEFKNSYRKNFPDKLLFETITKKEIEEIRKKGPFDFVNLSKLAIDYSDGVVQASDKINDKVLNYINESKVNFLSHNTDLDAHFTEIYDFYNKIL